MMNSFLINGLFLYDYFSSYITFFLSQWSVLLPVVLTLIATQENQSGLVKHLSNLCYTKYALEAFVIANAERFDLTISFPRCSDCLVAECCCSLLGNITLLES